jgi:hypothetical protein
MKIKSDHFTISQVRHSYILRVDSRDKFNLKERYINTFKLWLNCPHFLFDLINVVIVGVCSGSECESQAELWLSNSYLYALFLSKDGI